MKKITILAAAVMLSAPAAAGKLDLTPAMAFVLADTIRAENMNCPAVKMAWDHGEGALGWVLKVFCGPEDRDGIFENAVFRVTMRPDDSFGVEPWRD